MTTPTKVYLQEVHAVLKPYLEAEKSRYKANNREASYNSIAREQRREIHAVLASLVPGFRALDKALTQPGAEKSLEKACNCLAGALIDNFVVESRVPETNLFWVQGLTSLHLRALVATSGRAGEDMLSLKEVYHPGIIPAVCRGYAVNPRGIREAYQQYHAEEIASQKVLLKDILAKVKLTLTDSEFAFLNRKLGLATRAQ